MSPDLQRMLFFSSGVNQLNGTVQSQILWFKCVTLIKVAQYIMIIFKNYILYHRYKEIIIITRGQWA